MAHDEIAWRKAINEEGATDLGGDTYYSCASRLVDLNELEASVSKYVSAFPEGKYKDQADRVLRQIAENSFSSIFDFIKLSDCTVKVQDHSMFSVLMRISEEDSENEKNSAKSRTHSRVSGKGFLVEIDYSKQLIPTILSIPLGTSFSLEGNISDDRIFEKIVQENLAVLLIDSEGIVPLPVVPSWVRGSQSGAFKINSSPLNSDVKALVSAARNRPGEGFLSPSTLWILEDNLTWDEFRNLRYSAGRPFLSEKHMSAFGWPYYTGTGDRFFSVSDAARALKRLSEAGLDPRRSAIWKSRREIIGQLKSEDTLESRELATWLEERSAELGEIRAGPPRSREEVPLEIEVVQLLRRGALCRTESSEHGLKDEFIVVWGLHRTVATMGDRMKITAESTRSGIKYRGDKLKGEPTLPLFQLISGLEDSE